MVPVDWEYGVEDWHWVGPTAQAQALLRSALVKGRGPALVLVTDGGLASTAVPSRERQDWQLKSVGSCGWVMGVGSSRGSAGEGLEQPRALAEGGGVEPHRGWGADSSFRSELWGVVSALRMLNQWCQKGEAPGCVYHWADNKGVVSLLNQLVGGGYMRWCSRNNRDLWGEVRGRLRYWLARGGAWSSQWVKGHQDATGRQEGEYSLATRMNIRADGIATAIMNERSAPQLSVASGVRHQMPGGDWEGRGGVESTGQRWLDSLDSELVNHLGERNLRLYWQNRLEGRAASVAQRNQLGEEFPVPCIDRRLKVKKGGDAVGSERMPYFAPSCGGTTCHHKGCGCEGRN